MRIGYLIAFVLGAGAGIAGTARYMKKRFDKTEKTVYIYKPTSDPEQETEAKKVSMKGEDAPLNESLAQMPKKSYEELTSYAKPYQSSAIKEVVERLAEKETPAEKGESQMGAVIISPDEYEDDPSLSSMTLYLYSDGVLTSEEEEVIEVDIAVRMVGDLERFRNSSNRTLYVRNRKYGSDYEIIKVDKVYNLVRHE